MIERLGLSKSLFLMQLYNAMAQDLVMEGYSERIYSAGNGRQET